MTVYFTINNGEILTATQEERFSRKKHDSSFPLILLNMCLREKLNLNDVDYVIFTKSVHLKDY